MMTLKMTNCRRNHRPHLHVVLPVLLASTRSASSVAAAAATPAAAAAAPAPALATAAATSMLQLRSTLHADRIFGVF